MAQFFPAVSAGTDSCFDEFKSWKMKKLWFLPVLLVLSGCELIGDIFKAGVWSGIILVVVLLGLIVFILSRLFGGR